MIQSAPGTYRLHNRKAGSIRIWDGTQPLRLSNQWVPDRSKDEPSAPAKLDPFRRIFLVSNTGPELP